MWLWPTAFDTGDFLSVRHWRLFEWDVSFWVWKQHAERGFEYPSCFFTMYAGIRPLCTSIRYNSSLDDASMILHLTSVFIEILHRLHLRWWMENIYKHFNKVCNIISKMCWTDRISKSIGEYNVFYASDIEGMSKFILDVNFSTYVKREMNVMSKGGVEVCHPYGVATWHWCDKHSLSLQ